MTGTSEFLSRESRGIDPHLEMRRGKGSQIEVFQATRCSSRVGTGMLGNFLSCIKCVKYPSRFKRECGICLKILLWNRASSHVEWRISWFFTSCSRKLGVPLELLWGPQGPAGIASEKSGIFLSCEWHVGIPLELVQGTTASCRVEAGNSGFLSSSDRDLRAPMDIPLESQTSSRVGAWNSACLSRW